MKFPEKKPGDSLQASHVNDLNDAARQVVGMKVGGNITKHQSDSFLGLYGNPAWHQYTFEITGNVNSTADGLFKGKIRYWDAVALEWKTNDAEYQIDTTDSGLAASIGNRLACYWDKQRCMFLPCSAFPNRFYNGSGETVPAYAVMAVTGVQTLADGSIVPKIGKTTSPAAKSYLVNGSVAVPIANIGLTPPTDGTGSYQDSDFRDVLVAYDTGTPAVGEEWGPKSGQWSLAATGSPKIFAVYGVVDATNKIAFGRLHILESLPPPVFFKKFTWIQESTGSTVEVLSEDALISANIDDTPSEVVGNAADARVTVLLPSAYQDPCLQVDEAGLWYFDISGRFRSPSTASPTWTGSVSGATCTLTPTHLPYIGISIICESQPAAGGSWSRIAFATTQAIAIVSYGANHTIHATCVASLGAGDKVRIYLYANTIYGALSTDTVVVDDVVEMIVKKVGTA